RLETRAAIQASDRLIARAHRFNTHDFVFVAASRTGEIRHIIRHVGVPRPRSLCSVWHCVFANPRGEKRSADANRQPPSPKSSFPRVYQRGRAPFLSELASARGNI